MLSIPREETGESSCTWAHHVPGYAADRQLTSNNSGNGELTPGLSFVLHAHCGVVSPYSHNTSVHTCNTKKPQNNTEPARSSPHPTPTKPTLGVLRSFNLSCMKSSQMLQAELEGQGTKVQNPESDMFGFSLSTIPGL